MTGDGVPRLLELIREREVEQGEIIRLRIPIDDSRPVSQLHELGQIHEKTQENGHFEIVAWVPKHSVHQFSEYRSEPDRLDSAKNR